MVLIFTVFDKFRTKACRKNLWQINVADQLISTSHRMSFGDEGRRSPIRVCVWVGCGLCVRTTSRVRASWWSKLRVTVIFLGGSRTESGLSY